MKGRIFTIESLLSRPGGGGSEVFSHGYRSGESSFEDNEGGEL